MKKIKVVSLSQIKTTLKSEKANLSKKYGVSKIGVFGSFAFGDFNKKSDVDILVNTNKPIGLFELVAMEEYLTDRLGRKVDLVTSNGLKKYIKRDVLNSTVYV